MSLRVPLKAGPHSIGMTFRRSLVLDESVQTLHNDIDYVVMPVKPPAALPLLFVVDGGTVGETTVPSYYLSPRFSQANWPRDVLQVDVTGPYEAAGPGDTPSRRRIFLCQPKNLAEEPACAQRIVTSLARQAWRGRCPSVMWRPCSACMPRSARMPISSWPSPRPSRHCWSRRSSCSCASRIPLPRHPIGARTGRPGIRLAPGAVPVEQPAGR